MKIHSPLFTKRFPLLIPLLFTLVLGLGPARAAHDHDTDNDLDGEDLASLAVEMADGQAGSDDLAEFAMDFGCIHCSQTVETVLIPEADAFANEYVPWFDRNRDEPAAHHNGGFGGIRVRTPGNGYGASGYLRFSLGSIDPGAVSGALLRLYHPRTFDATLVIRQVDDDTWDEAMANANEAPAAGDIIGSVAIVQGWNECDVTEFIAEQADAAVSFELTLSEVQYDATYFISREGRSDWRPQLVVTHTGSDTPGDTASADSSSGLPETSVWLVSDGTWTQYEDSQDAADAAGPGDEIVFGPGTHYQTFNINNDGTADKPITIRGDGDPRPVLDASGLTDISGYGRGVIGIYAEHILVENLEIKDASKVCGHEINAAALYVVYAADVIVRDCYFHHNGNGVFVTSHCENYTQEYCEVAYNSYYGAGHYHGHYLNGSGTTTVRFNHIHSNGGQGYKDRCENTIFAYNYVHDNYNYEVDFMEEDHGTAQNALLIGNIIKKYPYAENHSKVICFGEDRHGGVCTLINNTVIVTDSRTSVIQLWDNNDTGMDRIEMYNNVFYGTDIPELSILYGDESRLSGSHNWMPAGATETGLLTDSVLGTDPGLADPDTGDEYSDYFPVAGSDCINAATPAVSELPEYEYVHPASGAPRPDDVDGLDIGAYEYVP